MTVKSFKIVLCPSLFTLHSRVVLEPAGALGVAGMKKYLKQNKIEGQTVVAITSGKLDLY